MKYILMFIMQVIASGLGIILAAWLMEKWDAFKKEHRK